VGEIVLIQVNFAVVKEAHADFFDIPIHGASPCIQSYDGVKVLPRNCWFAAAQAGDIVISSAAHPEARKNFTPQRLPEATTTIRVGKCF
jgi:hypothetical protein